ncbi:hypothetical protein ASPZODRAFT_126737 [Penicilliopsis zonata CBS 506.65]|uniref:RlpA-like protein double-psi beta-barrel domain-containing protein n=1 Tax=Penicilliopsis zonata CBS 506.65 TaxID=1073090 RepID=A0A1L9SU97_9EURO|nr:hypothetical protein ASPZODRAFT_126737 [Penicilliopsis zonata CBS 506.65]OJJ50795.1 hypothetical protein ASPZODRAFT_126737 [Penicilliopsis zonata CBS 506.65]
MMVVPEEKDLPPTPPHTSGDVDVDKELPTLKDLEDNTQTHLPPALVPKRKPVPTQSSTAAALPAAEVSASTALASGNWFERKWGSWTNHANPRQRRTFIIAGIIIGVVVLLALIIGLAVGLTVGKRHHSSSLSSSYGGPYTGDLTYYDPGLGACGITSTSSEMIVAVSHVLFDAAYSGSDPNDNPLCGLKLRIERDSKTVDVKIVDRCA